MDRTHGLFLPEDENLREKGDWSQFTLWQQGERLISWSFSVTWWEKVGRGPSGNTSQSLGNPDYQNLFIES